MFSIHTNNDGIDWQEAALLYKKAPLGERDPQQLSRAFQKSSVVVFIFDNDVLIGAGRAISDDEYYAGIFDVAVLPEYQGKGVGRQIMDFLLQQLQDKFIILTTTLGKQDFYRKWGFKKHTTAMAIYPTSKQENAKMYLED